MILLCRNGQRLILSAESLREGASSLAVMSIQFSPDETMLAIGSLDCSIRLLRLVDDQGKNPLFDDSYRDECTNAQLSHELACYSRILHLQGHTKPIHSLVFTPDSQTLISASHEGVLRFWDTETGVCTKRIDDSLEEFESISIAPDGETLAASCWSGGVRLYSISSSFRSSTSHTFLDTAYCMTRIQFSKDGKWLYGLHRESDVPVWNVSSGTIVRHLERPSNKNDATMGFGSVAVAPNGDKVAHADEHGTVCISETTEDSLPLRLKDKTRDGARRQRCRVMFSPDGKTLVAASSDGRLWLWGQCM